MCFERKLFCAVAHGLYSRLQVVANFGNFNEINAHAKITSCGRHFTRRSGEALP